MKSNIQISLYSLLLVLGSLLAACEVIPENEQMIPVEMEETNRTTLIVEFSGLRCNNCPLAAEEAHNLLAMYGDKLVVVEMHPASNSLTNGGSKWDYTCPASDAYYLFFGDNTIAPLPNGVINMTRTNNAYFVDYHQWGAAYQQSAKMYSPITLAQHVQMDSTNTVHLETSISNLSYDPLDVQYIAWLTEDSIVGGQLMPDGKTQKKDYVHNHILRDTITDIWGLPLTIAAEDSAKVELTYTLPEKVVAKNCNIVGIVMKDGEAIQVNEYKLNNIIK